MSHKTVAAILAAAVAAGGTFTVSYPTGYNRGHFERAKGHYFTALGSKYVQPTHFTLSFGATAVTVTLAAGLTTIPAGTPLYFQLEMVGAETMRVPAREQIDGALSTKFVEGVALKALSFNLGAPLTLDADGICASQSVTLLVEALLNGALTTGNTNDDGSVNLDVPRALVAAWTTTAILTITGKDQYGQTIVEKSASGTTFTGKKAFAKITSAVFSASVTGATIGTSDVLGLPVWLKDGAHILSVAKDGRTYNRNPRTVRLPFYIDVTDTGVGSAAGPELISPVAGAITSLVVVVRTAISTGGAVTAAVGTTAVTGLSVTVANSATKGTAASDAPSNDGTEIVAVGDRIQIIPGDAFNGGGDLEGYIEITPTYPHEGTWAYGLSENTASTATTADVRGTFKPVDACDGAVGYELIVLAPDPQLIGNPQYAG